MQNGLVYSGKANDFQNIDKNQDQMIYKKAMGTLPGTIRGSHKNIPP